MSTRLGTPQVSGPVGDCCCPEPCDCVTCECCRCESIPLLFRISFGEAVTWFQAPFCTGSMPADEEVYPLTTSNNLCSATGHRFDVIAGTAEDLDITLVAIDCEWYVSIQPSNLLCAGVAPLNLKLSGFDCCSRDQTVALTDPSSGTLEVYTAIPTTMRIQSCGCCTCCGDPENFSTTTLTSDSPTFDGLVVPIEWDDTGCEAFGSLPIDCGGCDTVSVLITCSGQSWTQTVAVTGEACAITPPSPGCVDSNTTNQCEPCLILSSRTCFEDVGTCGVGPFYIDAVTSTCP